jgi:N utilization substance protein A
MNRDIVESFADMVKEKGIDKDVLAGIIEEVFGILVKKKYGEEAQYEVVVNMDRGDIQIFLEREIVDEVTDENTQISIDEINEKGNEDELEVGEDYVEEITLVSLGRRLVLLAKQSLNQKIREIEKDVIYNEYKELLGEIVVGDIYQIRKNDILVNHNKNELLLPRNEQIPFERYPCKSQ